MRISIFGIGYVGAVNAGCLARDGHEVVAVDVNPIKVDAINCKQSPIAEPGLQELIAAAVGREQLSATASGAEAIGRSDLSLVCVGTPSNVNGSLNLESVEAVCREIGEAIRNKSTHHSVVLRSTLLPATMRNLVIPTLESGAGKAAGAGFGVGYYPEFLREGTAITDYDNPPKTVFGVFDDRAGKLLEALFARLPGPVFHTTLEIAEMVKYADNSWHALKVAYANEIGAVCKAYGIDSHAVMHIFCQDRKLNISPHYLRPGFAFGGSCLPKDVRALSHLARGVDIETPILDAILPSNRAQVERGLQMIRSFQKKKVGILGVTFKAGTDDLRESPMVQVIETLIGKGYEVRAYDGNIRLDALTGANHEYINAHIPHIADLLSARIEDVLNWADVVVVGNEAEEFRDALARLRSDQAIVDFVRIAPSRAISGQYAGISW